MTIKRIGVLSCGKISGLIYAAIGLLIGGIATLFSLVIGAAGMAAGADEAIFSLFFGGFSIIIFPLMYGAIGFISGLITAAIYNFAANFVGGIEVEVEQKTAPRELTW